MTEPVLDEDWSVPTTTVMRGIRRTLDADGTGVLATIVSVDGSAYRRPGAKMVLSAAGNGLGSITAGCLEDEVRTLAEEVQEEGRPRLETFDLVGEDDVWGLGLGCNGVIDLLLEPVGEAYRPVIDAYEAGERVAVLTVLESDGTDLALGDRLQVAPEDFPLDGPADWPAWLLEDLGDPVADLLENGQSRTLTSERDGETVRVFVDAVTPPADLVVFGTGHDVGPVVDLAGTLEFRVTVVGFRGAEGLEDRFPDADRVITTRPADVTDALEFDGDTYTVVMTHNFVDDQLVLEELLDTDVPYVGLMGPSERFERLLDVLAEGGDPVGDAALDRLYAPIGLDLGGGTPHSIALSIVGEVQAVEHGRDPGHLRDRKSPIHDRLDLEP